MKSQNRLTFRKTKQPFQVALYEIRLGGEKVGCIQYTHNGSRWYWYTNGWSEYRNTITIQGSATDLEGCKDECRRFFLEKPE